MTEAFTDCRSEEGITVGLIDTLITICRILRHRDLSGVATKEALKDLASDEDFLWFCPNELPPMSGEADWQAQNAIVRK